MIRKKSKEELLQQVLKGIVQETSITMVGRGSVTASIASAISGSIEEVYAILDDAVTNSFLPTANGFYLDLFGETFGLTRKVATAAVASASDRAVKFYVNSGTLASKLPHPTDLNKGRVPAGTEVSTESGKTYTVDGDYDFPASSKEVFVGVVSSETGTTTNTGAGTIVNTSATGVLVTNVIALNSGRNIESDDEFRFRISRWVRTSAGKNEMAVRLAVLAAPNVADMIKEPYFAGAGSFRIVVIPTGNRVSTETLRVITSNLASVVSEGTFYVVEGPRYLPVSMSVRLVPFKNRVITATDRALVKEQILSYLGNIRPGETLVVNKLRSIALGSTSNIADVVIQGISIGKRPRALVNYTLENDELFVADDEINNPILVN